MNRTGSRRYYDLSILLALGMTALFLISVPGGCGDNESTEDGEDVSSEEVAEPTEPPMMEIVDPEPGDVQTAPSGDDEEEVVEEEPAEDDDSPETENGSQGDVYVVQQGDTLYDIAVDLGVGMEELMAANNMDDPNQLQVGQELQIPN